MTHAVEINSLSVANPIKHCANYAQLLKTLCIDAGTIDTAINAYPTIKLRFSIHFSLSSRLRPSSKILSSIFPSFLVLALPPQPFSFLALPLNLGLVSANLLILPVVLVFLTLHLVADERACA